MKEKSVAVVILSNGPGELTTWVKPVINNLRKEILTLKSKKHINLHLRLILVPCPNANGNEYEIAKKWPNLDLITPAKKFWQLLINPYSFIKWPESGLVVFLGGDQLWSVLLAKRLGYKCITYAEWEARWPRWNSSIAAMNEKVKKRLPLKYQKKCRIVGDLMADINNEGKYAFERKNERWIAILPGSKKTKLSIGIPFFLEMADHISSSRSDIKLMIPIAPTITIKDFLYYQSNKNPLAKNYSSKIKYIKKSEESIFHYELHTENNTKIYLISNSPSNQILRQCELAITTVGANTAELAAINLPMIVVLPTQHLDLMNSWDGIFGIIGKIPIINKIISTCVKNWYLNNKQFFAWPNIKAKRLVVPERIGEIHPKEIADEAIHLLSNSNLLQEQRRNLKKERGSVGAVQKLTRLIIDSITH